MGQFIIREHYSVDEYVENKFRRDFEPFLHLNLCDEEKTLTIQRVDEVLAQVMKMLQDKWQVKQR